VLLSLTNPPVQTDTPYALSFTASSTNTVVSLSGYQVPDIEYSTSDGVFLNESGPNLLGKTWVFTPAKAGSFGVQGYDGTSINCVGFAGIVIGSYDTFSQSVATIPGASYTIDFRFSELAGGPSAFTVAVNAPEPMPIALLAVGLLGIGIATVRRHS
jgi:hypothetical protein